MKLFVQRLLWQFIFKIKAEDEFHQLKNKAQLLLVVFYGMGIFGYRYKIMLVVKPQCQLFKIYIKMKDIFVKSYKLKFREGFKRVLGYQLGGRGEG